MTGKELFDEITKKVHTDDEYLELMRRTKEFLASDISEEERALFVPIGAYEMLDMICAGIEEERKNHESESSN